MLCPPVVWQTSEDRDFQKSWQEIYDTDDRGLAEERAHDTGADTIEYGRRW